MLIINIGLFISAICSATNIAISTDTSVLPSVASAKLKRGIVDPGPDTRSNQEPYRGAQSTTRILSPQDINSKSPHYRNTKTSDTQRASHANPNQRSASHAYGSVPKRQFSYDSSATQQTESHRNGPIAPYFNLLNNPNAYKAATSAAQLSDASKSIVSQSLQKLQEAYSPSYNTFHPHKPIELSGFTEFEYPSYSSISKIISQGFPSGVSPAATQIPVYKSSSYPLPKATEYANIYAPTFSTTTSSATPLFQSDKTKQIPKQSGEATVNVNGKKVSVPIIQLQSNPGLSDDLPVFESQPFLINANYPIEQDFEFNFGDMPKPNAALQSKNASPFLSPLSSFQGQIVPIQTASSTPQFPQYKGASIQVYPVLHKPPKMQGSYESLYSQPQLHFGKGHAGQTVNPQQNVIPSSVSTEDILDDVEIINKKNPQPHPAQTDDDEEEEEEEERDMRYKNPEQENEHSFEEEEEEDDVESEKYFKEPPTTESDFKPSTAFPFKEYDETFEKYAPQTDDEDSEDKPYSGYKNPSSDDEVEDDPLSGYNAEFAEPPKSHGSYEEEGEEEEEEGEEEEESRKYEKRGETEENSREVEPKQSKRYEKDFEQEFEESYRQELPKQEYVHVKEVPEIDSYNNPKPRQQTKNNNSRGRINHERTEESRARGSRASRKNRKTPKTGYRDNAAYGSNVSAKKASKVVYEEFFGYKNPKTGKYSKRAKTESAVEKYSPPKKSTAHKEDSYLRATKYYKFKSPKTGSRLASKNKYPHSYSPASNWKSSKIPTAEADSGSNARQLADSGDGALLYIPSALNGQVRSITNEEIFRDLTGI